MEATARGIHRRTSFSVTTSLRLRFEAKVHQASDKDCWAWQGAQRNGYGAIKHEGKILSAHVVAWVLANGRMPQDGHIICHHCDNRFCVNPSHLYEGTFADNVHDADKRRKFPVPAGEQSALALFTNDEVRLLLALRVVYGWGYRRISQATGIRENPIDDVIRRRTYSCVAIPTADEAAAIVEKWEQCRQMKG